MTQCLIFVIPFSTEIALLSLNEQKVTTAF